MAKPIASAALASQPVAGNLTAPVAVDSIVRVYLVAG